MMNGIDEPSDFRKTTAVTLIDTPVGSVDLMGIFPSGYKLKTVN